MSETQSQEIEQLRAECAALRAVLTIVIASLHGRLDLGSIADRPHEQQQLRRG
jgi:hypothetical protein